MAPWRQGSVEAMHKIFVQCMKRSNLASKSYDMTEWVHILSYITYEVNIRPLSLKFNENLMVLTPMKLIFGNRRNCNVKNMSIENNRLYTRLHDLEKELLYFKRLYIDTYLQESKRTHKWKTQESLNPGDIVYVLDHANKDGYPTIGLIKEKKSDRTYIITYVKKEAQTNPENKIIRGAVLSELTRPAQGLSLICEANQEEEVDLEPAPRDSVNEVITIPKIGLKMKMIKDKDTTRIKDIS